jgi:hypothetical protein
MIKAYEWGKIFHFLLIIIFISIFFLLYLPPTKNSFSISVSTIYICNVSVCLCVCVWVAINIYVKYFTKNFHILFVFFFFASEKNFVKSLSKLFSLSECVYEWWVFLCRRELCKLLPVKIFYYHSIFRNKMNAFLKWHIHY